VTLFQISHKPRRFRNDQTHQKLISEKELTMERSFALSYENLRRHDSNFNLKENFLSLKMQMDIGTLGEGRQ